MAIRKDSLIFDTMSLEGGLFVPELLERAAQGRADYQHDSDYDIPKGLKLQDEYGRAFQIALAEGASFTHNIQRSDIDKYALTEKYVYTILSKCLGYEITPKGHIVCKDRTYPITADTNHNIAIVVASGDIDLDTADERFAVAESGSHKKTAFHLTQEFLNASPEYLWAIVTNGRQFRLLRDSAAMTRPCYLEFDLEAIVKDQCYSDFTGLWRILHATRSCNITSGNLAGKPIWEAWYQAGLEQGTRIRDGLRNAVTDALIAIGSGFLSHPDNNELRDKLQNGSLTANSYFQQLLRFVYRMLFLFTVEERGILHADDNTPDGIEARKFYEEGYSQKRLRKYSLRYTSISRDDYHCDSYSDLWQAQQVVFKGLQHGEKALALPALGGLFASDQCPDIDAAQLSNNCYMAVIRSLRWYQSNGELSPVDYGNMGTEELGSVYESLLELVPYISIENRTFGFVGITESGSAAGNARKTSGSYYTPDSLVQELIKSALDPVIENKINNNPQEPVKALLDMSIIDPACGSGHFLLAAARRIAEKLAALESVDGSVKPNDYRSALRKVIANCIYGVDLNPMAVELAKTALWLEGFEPGKPLGFIDNHILCGDALLGIISTEQMTMGIPEDAYDALSGDDKDICKNLKKQNREEAKKLCGKDADLIADDAESKELSDLLRKIEGMPEETQSDISAKRKMWLEYQNKTGGSKVKKAADLFVGAWLAPKVVNKNNESMAIPTTADLIHELRNPFGSVITATKAREEQHNRCIECCTQLCKESKVFHWPLVFENIFKKGGFDCVLANPPWERIKLQEEEFFASRNETVANARNKAERKKCIDLLKDGRLASVFGGLSMFNPIVAESEKRLYKDFETAKRSSEASSNYIHVAAPAGRFPLTGVGDVNTYAVFSETITRLVSEEGRAGFIVPSGIATDNSTKDYFASVATTGKLVSLYDFENRDALFPGVHRSYKFSLFTLGKADKAEFAFFMSQPDQIKDDRRKFTLTPEEFELINPNTLTCPIFRSKYDAELTKKIYRRVPVLILEERKELSADGKHEIIKRKGQNPWNIRFSSMFHMSNDSNLFHTTKSEGCLPLYEAKLMHQFDHRWARYGKKNDKLTVLDITDEEKTNPNCEITPQYWVKEKYVLARTANVPDEFARAYEKDDFETIGVLLANWILACDALNDVIVANLINNKTENGKKLLDMVNTISRYKKSKLYLEKFQKKAEDYPLTDDEIKIICDNNNFEEIANKLIKLRAPKWLAGFRGICRATDERTLITDVIYRVGIGNSLPVFHGLNTNKATMAACLIANMNSIVTDYCVREKVGGINLNFFIIMQFPVVLPEMYGVADLKYLIPRILELTYNTNSMRPWAEDVYSSAPEEVKTEILRFCNVTIDETGLFKPFTFNPERRALLRAELDAYYAKLYGLTRDELRYVLDPADVMGEDYPSETFRVLKENEIAKYGYYRTRGLVLSAFDNL